MPELLYLDDAGVATLKTLIGEPTDEQVTTAVHNELVAHPEWTTTVQDGSITGVKIADDTIPDAKLAQDGIKAQVGYLVNDAVRQFDTLGPYLYKRDTYIANDNVDTTLAGYDTYKVPVKQGDLIVMHWSETFWGGLSKGFYVITVEFEDRTITRVAIDASNVVWYRFSSNTKQGIARMPENAKYFVVTVQRTYFDAITDFMVNTPNVVLNDGTTVRRLQTLLDIDETCAGKSSFFFSTAASGTGAVNDPYSAFLLPVRSGDKIRFSGRESAFSYYGTFTGIADETTVQITTSDFTAPADGIVCEFPYVDGSPNATIISADSIKIDASNIVNAPELSFSGIEWVSFGDSITAQNKWQPYIVNALGMSHTNCGIGSTPLSGSNANAFWQTVRLNAVKAANPDLVTILGGANDLVLNPVIGTDANLADKDTSTFIGAYSYIINDLLTWKPSLRIVILSTTWAHDDGATYSQTVTYGQFAAACKKVAEYYKLPFVDLYDNSGFNAYTMGTSPNNIYSSDSIHPNEAGAKIIASQVLAKLREVMLIH